MGGQPAKRTILLLAGSQDIVRGVSYPLEQLLHGRYNVEAILDNVFPGISHPTRVMFKRRPVVLSRPGSTTIRIYTRD